MAAKINLARSPFLTAALDYISAHPGCSKNEVVLGLNRGIKPPTKTMSNQYSRIGTLISAGLVENRGTASKYELYVAEYDASGISESTLPNLEVS